MKKRINYIIREVPPEHADFSYYFDNDGLTAAGGDYCNNLFIVNYTRHSRGFNEEEYQNIVEQAEAILDGFHDVNDKWTNGYNSYASYKEVLEYNNVLYSPRKCHLLKEWAEHADTSDTETIAEYLTITTGKKWAVDEAYGYCQGDYVEMVYCEDHYKDGVQHYGEIWLGAGTEFYVIDLDENGEEVDTYGGYIVADSQAWKDEDYKRLVCEWAGIPEDETRLERIDSYRTVTQYTYRAV
ncbi:MAG: hypothetical protein WC239_09375 [Sphaerochaetaceae bacterium]